MSLPMTGLTFGVIFTRGMMQAPFRLSNFCLTFRRIGLTTLQNPDNYENHGQGIYSDDCRRCAVKYLSSRPCPGNRFADGEFSRLATPGRSAGFRKDEGTWHPRDRRRVCPWNESG